MKLLETHGCQGIGHAGYTRAGWDVTAVDINKNHTEWIGRQLAAHIAGERAA